MTMDTITMSKMARKKLRKGGRNVSMITALLASAETWSWTYALKLPLRWLIAWDAVTLMKLHKFANSVRTDINQQVIAPAVRSLQTQLWISLCLLQAQIHCISIRIVLRKRQTIKANGEMEMKISNLQIYSLRTLLCLLHFFIMHGMQFKI